MNEPFVVREVNKFDQIITNYIFVGDVDKQVSTQLKKLSEGATYDKAVLRKYYGNNWRELLLIDDIKGGADASASGISVMGCGCNCERGKCNCASDGCNCASGGCKCVSGGADYVADDVGLEMVTLDDDILEQFDTTAFDDIVLEVGPVDVFQSRSVKIKKADGIENVYVYRAIYEMDNIWEIKQKIYNSIGLPTYRQHLYFRFNGIAYPLYYNLSLYGQNSVSVTADDIFTFYNKGKSEDSAVTDIDGLPINMQLFQNKDFVKIIAQDTFILYSEIVKQYGVQEIFLLDMNQVISAEHIYTTYSTNQYYLNLIYYGFIVLYYPAITYGVFTDLIKSEKTLESFYPELLPNLDKQLDLEDTITAVHSTVDQTQLNKRLTASITSTIIEANYYSETTNLISVRALFDAFELDPIICHVSASVDHGKIFILHKSYHGELPPIEKIPVNSICFTIKIDKTSQETIRFFIFNSGDYLVYTNWREEQHMTFDAIKIIVIKYCNSVIERINNMGSAVKTRPLLLNLLRSSAATFKETNMTFFYEDDISENRFNILHKILDDFKLAGIITPKESDSLEYFFRKGMHCYDVSRIDKVIAVANYYEYLSNAVVKSKWETIFHNTRLFSIINLSSKLKVTISGIRNDVEMNVFYYYLTCLFTIYEQNAKKRNTSADIQVNRGIKTLKVMDPVLYDPRKYSGTNIVYSKICQRPYQPQILSDAEYAKLSADKKENAVRYWNFTTERPVYYSCPSERFPHIKYITNQHPKGYCIPCCKKLAVDEHVNPIKQEIHRICTTKHCYTGEKTNLIKGSSYIAAYGKTIEPGRISRLPERTLEPLFFNTYSTGVTDIECSAADGYYLFGVEQHLMNARNTGIIHILAHVLSITVDQLIIDVAVRLKQYPDRFKILIDGQITKYYQTVTDLIFSIERLNEGMEQFSVDINALFQSIAFYYLGISVILFEDSSKEQIELKLPHGLKSPEEMFPPTHRYIVVLSYMRRYYPIYLVNTELFKKTGILDAKIYDGDSGLLSIIRSIVVQTFSNNAEEINLSMLTKFCDMKSTGWSIVKRFINMNNLCYAAVIQKGKSIVHVPIAASYYAINTKIESRHDPLKLSDLGTRADMLQFFKDFHNTHEITIKQWLRVKDKPMIIGCLAQDSMFFFQPCPTGDGTIQTLLHNPLEINKIIYQAHTDELVIKHDIDKFDNEIKTARYKYYLFPLFMSKLLYNLDKSRSMPTRKKLKDGLDSIDRVDKTAFKSWLDTQTDADATSIKNIISRYITKHHSKKIMRDEVDSKIFDFDQVILAHIRDADDVTTELRRTTDKFVVVVSRIVPEEINNTIHADLVDKIQMTKEQYNDILSITAALIVDEQKWVINAIRHTQIEFFQFIRRKNETITVLNL